MKKILFLLITIICISCSNETTDPISRKILQKIDIDSSGLIKIKEKSETIKINDSTYQLTYSFNNPMLKKDVRLTRHFIFNNTLDSIKKIITIKGELKSQGEWVTSNMFN